MKWMNVSAALAGAAFLMLTLCGCPAAIVTKSSAIPNQSSMLGELDHEYVAANLHGAIDSYSLFGCLPLLTGNVYRPNSETYDKFKDYATPAAIRVMLENYGEKMLEGDRVLVYRVQSRSTGWWSLWLLWHSSVTADAEVLRKK